MWKQNVNLFFFFFVLIIKSILSQTSQSNFMGLFVKSNSANVEKVPNSHHSQSCEFSWLPEQDESHSVKRQK